VTEKHGKFPSVSRSTDILDKEFRHRKVRVSIFGPSEFSVGESICSRNSAPIPGLKLEFKNLR